MSDGKFKKVLDTGAEHNEFEYYMKSGQLKHLKYILKNDGKRWFDLYISQWVNIVMYYIPASVSLLSVPEGYKGMVFIIYTVLAIYLFFYYKSNNTVISDALDLIADDIEKQQIQVDNGDNITESTKTKL